MRIAAILLAHGVTFATRASVGFRASNYGKGWQNELRTRRRSRRFGEHGPRAYHARTRRPDDLTSAASSRARANDESRLPDFGVSPHAVILFESCNVRASGQTRLRPGQFFIRVQSQELLSAGRRLHALGVSERDAISISRARCRRRCVHGDMSDVSPNANDIRSWPQFPHLSCGVGAAYDTPVGPISPQHRVPRSATVGLDTGMRRRQRIADPTNGQQPTIFGLPLAIAIGIGQGRGTDYAHRPPLHRVRSAFARIASGLGAGVGLPIVFVLSVVGGASSSTFNTAPVRRAVAQHVNAILAPTFKGSIRLDSVDGPRPCGVSPARM